MTNYYSSYLLSKSLENLLNTEFENVGKDKDLGWDKTTLRDE